MTLVISKGMVISKGIRLSNSYTPIDWEAADYARRVEAADGQALEAGVFNAYNNFVLGCKADGIWNTIKASCILAGARTLNGALVPLVGTAPTNFNFVAADYNRKTGLVGNGTTKYLNSNRSAISDPLDNRHFSAYVTQVGITDRVLIGYYAASPDILCYMLAGSLGWRWSCNTTIQTGVPGPSVSTGFAGVNKITSGNVGARFNSIDYAAARPNALPRDLDTFVFARNANNLPDVYSSARLAFYSIGEYLNLALLDARVTDLMNALAAAIP